MNGVKVCPFGLILRQDGATASRNPLECLPPPKTAKKHEKIRKMPRALRALGGPWGPLCPPWHCAAMQQAPVDFSERANDHAFDHLRLSAARISNFHVYLLQGRHPRRHFHGSIFVPFTILIILSPKVGIC